MQGQSLLTLEPKMHQNTNVFSDASLNKLFDIMSFQSFAPNSSLFWAGAEANRLFYLKQGQVKLTKASVEGKEFSLHFFQEGDLIADLSLFNGHHYSYSGIVTKKSVIGIIQRQDLELLLWQNGDFALEFMKWMSFMNRIIDSKLRDLMFHGKPGALCSTLIRMSNTYGRRTDQGILLEQKFTNAELGELIGATRESVNRMLSDLKQKAVIEQHKGHILIKDIDYLRDICHCENCPLGVCRI